MYRRYRKEEWHEKLKNTGGLSAGLSVWQTM